MRGKETNRGKEASKMARNVLHEGKELYWPRVTLLSLCSHVGITHWEWD